MSQPGMALLEHNVSNRIGFVFLLMLVLQSTVLSAQNSAVSSESILDGFWTMSANPQADYFEHNNIDGLFGISTRSADGVLWDEGVGGPFTLTKIQTTKANTFIVTFWFDRGGFEAAYSLEYDSARMELRAKILKGLEASSGGPWNKIPNSVQRIFSMKSAAFDPSIGIINDDRVRLRKKFGIGSPVMRLLVLGEQVDITGKSVRREVIGDVSAYWYEVRCKDNSTGWVYGQYVDLKKRPE